MPARCSMALERGRVQPREALGSAGLIPGYFLGGLFPRFPPEEFPVVLGPFGGRGVLLAMEVAPGCLPPGADGGGREETPGSCRRPYRRAIHYDGESRRVSTVGPDVIVTSRMLAAGDLSVYVHVANRRNSESVPMHSEPVHHLPAARRAVSTATAPSAAPALFISPDAVLEHWQGHRRLTRRVIEAFPEDQLFTFSVGGMRPFGQLAMEMLSMAVPMVRGVLTGEWNTSWDRDAKPKADILRQWDEDTETLGSLWAQIPASKWQEQMTAFGQYPGIAHDLLLYVIDNEIHHRGQGYVYLRALGIDPPPFYER